MNDDLTTYARMGLQAELARLDARRAELRDLLAQLDGPAAPLTRRRRMSAEGRQRIREAVQRRWAKVRATQESSGTDAGPGDAATKTSPAKKATSPGRRDRAGSRKK